MKVFFGFIGPMLWASCVLAQPQSVAIVLKDAQGEEVGELNLTQEAKGVRGIMHVKNLPPGQHALHFHEHGSCIAPDFKSAGSHFAPDKKMHGNVPGGPHAGDMNNIEVKTDGTGKVDFVNDKVTLKGGKNSLIAAKGTSVVIHAGPDDHKTQPSGASGDRIACGEIKSPL